MIDKNLLIKKSNSEIILVQIYVDDIIFGATQDSLCEEFVAAMKGEFVILPVDRSAGECLVKGSTCAPLLTSVPPLDLSQEPAKK